MANSVDPYQTALIGAFCSGSTPFASILEFVSSVRQFFCSRRLQQTTFSVAFFSWCCKG